MNTITDYFKNVFENYLADITIMDISLLKVCLLALGMVFGLSVPVKCKQAWFWVAFVVFFATYIPLMTKLIPYLIEET